MKFTIAIPTYNRPELVVKSVESALNQSKAPLEVLVHDNSTGDDTERSLSHFPKDLVLYRRHSNNIGIAGNWNSLIDAAQGDYIKFLNDDDQLDVDCLADAEKALGVYEAGVVTCRANYVTTEGNIIKADARIRSGQNYYVSGDNCGYLWLKSALPVRTPTHSFYHTQTALKLGRFTESGDYTRDVFLALRLAVAKGAIFLEEKPLASFLIHPGQDVNKIPLHVRVEDQNEVKRWAYDHCNKRHPRGELDVELNAVVLREALLMMKSKRWADALHCFSSAIHTPIGASVAAWRLLQREVFPGNYYSKFDQLRVYLD